ncbi:MAG: hypothetical protein J6K52_05875 [Clostridia bacterium]|nr:hypothetical protein [Clostridia bacterium]
MEENKNQDEIGESNEARRQRLLGVENDSKIHDEKEEIREGNFFANLWYKHKWALIIGSFFLLIAIIMIAQSATDPKYDMEMGYFGPVYTNNKKFQAIVNDAFEKNLPDYNEDGESKINFYSTTYRNEEQMKSEEFMDYVMSAGANREAKTSMDYQMMSGHTAFYLMDQKIYENYIDSFIKVEDILGYTPDEEIMCGTKGVYLNKTKFASIYSTLSEFPADTVICIAKNNITSEDDIEKAKDFFKKIVEME